jgi:DNA (cytosine-5)-methyltransferase 1
MKDRNELALYNEIDPFCADWLERLSAAGVIAPGVVERRSIVELTPDDVAGYRQVHFFAGIGVWSSAARAAGIRDDEPLWTGSCPCQPFSAAGKRGGFDDERHLWPAFHWLIEQCRPPKVAGEQVASPDGLRWLDLVQDDLEGTGYAFGAVDLCAAGACVDFAESEEGQATLEWIRGAVLHCPNPELATQLRHFAEWAGSELGYGAEHIRQRLWWMADSERARRERGRSGEAGWREPFAAIERLRDAGGVADTTDSRSLSAGRPQGRAVTRDRSASCGGGRIYGSDWIICTDGKARPTQPGVLPLAHAWEGPSRVALLRAAGNAIHKETATRFLSAAFGDD